MDTREYFHLQPGDVIQNLGSGSTYIVVEGYRPGIGNPVIAVRTITVSNIDEWKLVRKGMPVGESELELPD